VSIAVVDGTDAIFVSESAPASHQSLIMLGPGAEVASGRRVPKIKDQPHIEAAVTLDRRAALGLRAQIPTVRGDNERTT
jgi:hypothetical protein